MIASYCRRGAFLQKSKKGKKTTRPTTKRKSYENIIPVRSGHRGRIYHEDEAFIISYVFLRTNCREAFRATGPTRDTVMCGFHGDVTFLLTTIAFLLSCILATI